MSSPPEILIADLKFWTKPGKSCETLWRNHPPCLLILKPLLFSYLSPDLFSNQSFPLVFFSLVTLLPWRPPLELTWLCTQLCHFFIFFVSENKQCYIVLLWHALTTKPIQYHYLLCLVFSLERDWLLRFTRRSPTRLLVLLWNLLLILMSFALINV